MDEDRDHAKLSGSKRATTLFTTIEKTNEFELMDGMKIPVLPSGKTSSAYAKRIVTEKETTFWIQKSTNLLCYDPFGLDSISMKDYQWVRSTEKQFDHYVKYLATKGKQHLSWANRTQKF